MAESLQKTKAGFQPVNFRGFSVFVVRDDLSVLSSCPDTKLVLSGNKARKLFHYLQQDFPNISRVVSFGSIQSNMLYSLAILAKIKGWQLEFYVDHIPDNLLANPRGNYAAALALGAEVKIAPLDAALSGRTDTLFIPQGGASPEAEAGLKILADEINAWVNDNQIENPKLMLPSGTGTTAYYVQKHLPFEVLTCACVGSREYLKQQFLNLENNNKIRPTILPPISDENSHPRKFQFGKLYPEFYRIWEELKQETEITFDLLYDPLGWMHLIAYLQSLEANVADPVPTLIYVHQGGQSGNETMLQRYARKYDFAAQLGHK